MFSIMREVIIAEAQPDGESAREILREHGGEILIAMIVGWISWRLFLRYVFIRMTRMQDYLLPRHRYFSSQNIANAQNLLQ